MDSITQITLGAAVGEAVLGRQIGNKAMIWGGLAGLIPDLDVIPSQFMNAVDRVDFHRGITHSLIFALVLAPLLAWIARKLHPYYRGVSQLRWMLLFFLGLLTHALLDCFTTWGTQLFWPLDYRVAFQSVFVIDPLYSIPLLAGVVGAAFQRIGSVKRLRWNQVGLIISCGYLLLTLINKQYIEQQFQASLDQQNIAYQDITTRPTPFNNLLWSANAETADAFYTGYYSHLDEKWPIEFDRYPKRKALLTSEIRSKPVIQKLLGITQGKYVIEKGKKDDQLILHDLRFGQLAGWLPKSDYPRANDFVFSYEIDITTLLNSKKIGIDRPEPDMENATKILPLFWERLKGIGKKQRAGTAHQQ